MSSKYPSVTARERNVGRAGNFPRPVPRPANDNKMGSLILEGAGLALARKVNRFDPLIRAYIELGEAYHDWLYPGDVQAPAIVRYIPDAYWQFSCRGGGSQWRVGNSSFICGGTFHKVRSAVVSGWSPNFPTTTTAGFIGIAQDIGDYLPSPDPEDRVFEVTTKATRKSGAPSPTPVIFEVPVPTPGTVVSPVPFPVAYPLAVPFARPSKAPIQRPLPGEEPAEAPKPKPNKAPRKNPAHRMPYVGVPYVMPGQWPGPIQPPGAIVGYNPDGQFAVEPAPTVDTNAPPRALPGLGYAGGGPVYYEGKSLKKSAVVGAIWNGVGTVTEAMDFAVAMHKSILNRKYRLSDKASKAQVVNYMFTHPESWRHIDFAEGLRNYVNMQIGDYVAALGSNSSKKLAIEMGLTTGLDRALAQHGNRIFDYVNENGQMEEFAPQVDYDPETGEYTVSGPGFSFGFQWKKGK